MAVLRRDRFVCQLRLDGCMERATEADHIVPVSRGGAEYDVSNGQALCASCHSKKTASERARMQAMRSRFRPAYPHPGLVHVGAGR